MSLAVPGDSMSWDENVQARPATEGFNGIVTRSLRAHMPL